ncbi:MAG: PIN domain-containing protein [Coriobacteriia bacterium]|nr:PIN domain-containing protein [Coriobacteriia bacterium]
MAGSVLIDTNVVVYLVDARDVAKCERANAVLGALEGCREGVVSQQVLSECARVVTERLPEPLNVEDACDLVSRVAVLFPAMPVTTAVVTRAIDIRQRLDLSYWDAQIIATAVEHGMTHVLSEDLGDHAVYEGVTVVNPFAPDFDLASLLG